MEGWGSEGNPAVVTYRPVRCSQIEFEPLEGPDDGGEGKMASRMDRLRVVMHFVAVAIDAFRIRDEL